MEQNSAVFSVVQLLGIVQRAGSLGREQEMKGFLFKLAFLSLS